MRWMEDFVARANIRSIPVLDRFPPDFGRSPMMTEPDYEDRIKALEKQVTRLQKALVELDREWADSEGFSGMTEADFVEMYGLHHGDLAPIDGEVS